MRSSWKVTTTYIVTIGLCANNHIARAEESKEPVKAEAPQPKTSETETPKSPAGETDKTKNAGSAEESESAPRNVEEKFLYELRAPQGVHKYNKNSDACSTTNFTLPDGTEFSTLKIIKETNTTAGGTTATREQWLIRAPEQGYYCFDKNTFDNLRAQNIIIRKYHRGSVGPVYGLNLTLPFKIRPATAGFNTTLTQNIEIAGSLGWRWRISDTLDYHLNAPVISAGLTSLDIEKGRAPSAMTGTIKTFGVTASAGLVLELSDFQLGLMMGVDRATGDEGKGWVYNNKLWYSFGLGYSFLKSK